MFKDKSPNPNSGEIKKKMDILSGGNWKREGAGQHETIIIKPSIFWSVAGSQYSFETMRLQTFYN